jgi:hypothetical protein
MKKVFLSLVLLSALTWSCNNSKKEEKTDTKNETVQPAPVAPEPKDSTHTGDSTGKGEQAPPPKTN